MSAQMIKFLNSPVPDCTGAGRMPKVGDLFGLELECEGVAVGYDPEYDNRLKKGWDAHNDGSLRPYKGHHPCEWVFRGPVKFQAAVERVHNLFDYFSARKSKLVCSNRTSLHVHYNMGDKNVYQVYNLFILYTIFEDILDRYCGEDRNGNLFCLSSRHAEAPLRFLELICDQIHDFRVIEENARYCSLNLASLNKFGTVEFRGMRGLDNADDIIRWLTILNELCSYACYTMRSPSALVETISNKTPIGFMKEIFTEGSFKTLTEGLSEAEVDASVYEGLRLVQMLCYKIGAEFDKVVLKSKDYWDALGEKEIDEVVYKPAPELRPMQVNGWGPGIEVERARRVQFFRNQQDIFFRNQQDIIDNLLNHVEQAPAPVWFEEEGVL